MAPPGGTCGTAGGLAWTSAAASHARGGPTRPRRFATISRSARADVDRDPLLLAGLLHRSRDLLRPPHHARPRRRMAELAALAPQSAHRPPGAVELAAAAHARHLPARADRATRV